MTDRQHRIVNAIAVPAGLYAAYNSWRRGQRVSAVSQLVGSGFCLYMTITGRR